MIIRVLVLGAQDSDSLLLFSRYQAVEQLTIMGVRMRSPKTIRFTSYRLVLAVAKMNNGMTTKATTNPMAK